jgi:hypothetical protein
MTGLTPDITAVTVVEHGVLRLTFSDGLSADINVLDRMRGPVFADAVTSTGFAKVSIDPETGTVVWPGGADLAPDTLYVRARTGAWPDQNMAA